MSEVKRRCVIVTGTRRVPSDLCMWGEIMSAVDGAYLVITGGCSGVDQAAGYLATTVLGLDCLTIPAQWERDGRAAGPIRNQAMIDIAKKLEALGTKWRALHFRTEKAEARAAVSGLCARLGFP